MHTDTRTLRELVQSRDALLPGVRPRLGSQQQCRESQPYCDRLLTDSSQIVDSYVLLKQAWMLEIGKGGDYRQRNWSRTLDGLSIT